MDNSVPFEVIASPAEAWLAPYGTTFPDLDTATPASPWFKVGTNGNRSFTKDGVHAVFSQTLAFWRGLGSTGPRKACRSEEDVKVTLTLADITLEQLKLNLNGNTVSDVSAHVGTVGYRKIGLSRGSQLTNYALLVRCPSPYLADGLAQIEVPCCVISGNADLAFKDNGDPAAAQLEFTAIEDGSTAQEYLGRFLAQDAEALT